MPIFFLDLSMLLSVNLDNLKILILNQCYYLQSIVFTLQIPISAITIKFTVQNSSALLQVLDISTTHLDYFV